MITGILICLFLLTPEFVLYLQDKRQVLSGVRITKIKMAFWPCQWMKSVMITLSMAKISDRIAVTILSLLIISNIVFIYLAIRKGLKSILPYTTIIGFIALFTEIISNL